MGVWLVDRFRPIYSATTCDGEEESREESQDKEDFEGDGVCVCARLGGWVGGRVTVVEVTIILLGTGE